jgi:hypothetical protein
MSLKFIRRLSVFIGAFCILGETVRRWHTWQEPPPNLHPSRAPLHPFRKLLSRRTPLAFCKASHGPASKIQDKRL